MAIFHCLGDSRLPADSAACRIEGPAQTGSTALLPGTCLQGRGCQAALPLPARPAALPSPAAPTDPVAKPSPVPQRRLEAQGPSPARSSPGAALSYRGPSWLVAGSGRGNVPVRATCLPSVPPGPLMAPLHLAGVPGRGRELGMRTARQRRGVPSPTGWCGGRDKSVSLCLCPLRWPRWHRWLRKGPGDDGCPARPSHHASSCCHWFPLK